MRVVTVGSATVDVLVSGLASQQNVGDKQEVEHIDQYPGGGAVNAAAMLQSLGGQVSVLAAVGADMQAQGLRHSLEQAGIGVKLLQEVATQRTGTAVILVDAQGHATVYAQRGANRFLQAEQALLSLQQCDLLYMPPLASDALRGVLRAKRASGGQPWPYCVINPSVAHVRTRDADLLALLPYVDLLCLNAVEAQMLQGIAHDKIVKYLNIEQAQSLTRALCAHDKQSVLLTLGAEGAVLWHAGQHFYQPAQKRPKVLSTLGAGDAFSSSFSYYLLAGASPADALSQASQQAADVLLVYAANRLGNLRLECSYE